MGTEFINILLKSSLFFRQIFAVIGDYGRKLEYMNNQFLQLVSSRTPEYVLTLGNNNFNNGADSTIDKYQGQYYSSYIHPYSGSYGTGDTVNRFFLLAILTG